MKNLSFLYKGPLKSWAAYCLFSKKTFRDKKAVPVLSIFTISIFLFCMYSESVQKVVTVNDKETFVFVALFVFICSAAVAILSYVSFLILFFFLAVFLWASDIKTVAFSYRQTSKVLDGRDVIGSLFIKSRLKLHLNKVEYENFMGLKDSFNGSIKELIFVSKNI